MGEGKGGSPPWTQPQAGAAFESPGVLLSAHKALPSSLELGCSQMRLALDAGPSRAGPQRAGACVAGEGRAGRQTQVPRKGDQSQQLPGGCGVRKGEGWCKVVKTARGRQEPSLSQLQEKIIPFSPCDDVLEMPQHDRQGAKTAPSDSVTEILLFHCVDKRNDKNVHFCP